MNPLALLLFGVAAPFKRLLNFSQAPGPQSPVVQTYTLTATDVNNAFETNIEDGLAFIDLPKNLGNLYLHPSSFATGAGTDTSQAQFYVNGQPTGTRLNNAAMASAANVARVPTQGFRAGARVALKELT